jgi:hypothetical protein
VDATRLPCSRRYTSLVLGWRGGGVGVYGNESEQVVMCQWVNKVLSFPPYLSLSLR